MTHKLLFGISALLLGSAGIRWLVILMALRRGQATAAHRARMAARVYGTVAALGAAGIVLWLVL
jgi:hypothetical protein